MFKTVVTTAAAALVALTFGASAHAGGPTNGTMGANGISLNGLSINGLSINGMGINGITANAVTSNALGSNALNLNGTVPAASSFAIDGIELPAQAR